jgi:signal recognition particle subunit SRP54
MLEVLAQKLKDVFRKLGDKGRLSEADIDAALREVRLALLEADVNFKVVKAFLSDVRIRLVTSEVMESLAPAQQIIKVVDEELIKILGAGVHYLQNAKESPSVIMLVGLQGSGKTTTAAKLAYSFKQSGQQTLLIAADVWRPAAVEQLTTLGEALGVPVYSEKGNKSPQQICAHGLKHAKQSGIAKVVIDTQGRLHVDDELMADLEHLKADTRPIETLLVVDAMTGQDAVKVAEEFNKRIGLTGLVLTKLDGDARGGAALSISFVTGVPIKFIGLGEKADALEVFHSDRLASRILGMGDVLTLIEKTQKAFDEQKSKDLDRKMRSTGLDLEDFLDQMRQIRKMGPMSQILGMLPGMPSNLPDLSGVDEEKNMKRVEAIILSMTPEERRTPSLIGGSRRKRIARGSGTKPQDVNQLLNQFEQVKKLTQMAKQGKMPKNWPLPGGRKG